MNAITTFLNNTKQYKLCNSIIGDGLGKTTAALEFSKNNLNVLYLSCLHSATVKDIFYSLYNSVKENEKSITSLPLTSLINLIIEILNHRERLVIVDNADHLSATSMYYFFKLYECTKTNVGFTFIGRQRFFNNLLRFARGGMTSYDMVLPSNILFINTKDVERD